MINVGDLIIELNMETRDVDDVGLVMRKHVLAFEDVHLTIYWSLIGRKQLRSEESLLDEMSEGILKHVPCHKEKMNGCH